VAVQHPKCQLDSFARVSKRESLVRAERNRNHVVGFFGDLFLVTYSKGNAQPRRPGVGLCKMLV